MTKGAQLTESLRDLPAAVAGEGQLRRELLVERGMSDRGREIGETITVTAKLQQDGSRLQFGQVAYDMGFITRSQLDGALSDQRSDFNERFWD